MVSAVNNFVGSIVAAFSSMFSEEEVMREIPPFGALEWRTHGGLEVEAPEIPESLLSKLDLPCNFWPGKLIKETHMLCLIPNDMDLERLWECVGKAHHHSYSKSVLSSGDKAYWILITKKPIPNTERRVFAEQEELIQQSKYEAPIVLEAAIAILAAKFLGNVSLFAKHNQLTKCRESVEDRPLVVQADSNIHFGVSRDLYQFNGLAGVIRG